MTEFTRRDALKGGVSIAALASFASACAPAETLNATPDAITPRDGDSGFVDGVGMAAMIAAGDVSMVEAVEAAIARAEAVNGDINAIATKAYNVARAEVDAAPDGALAGVPTFIKDLANDGGVQTMYGSRAFRGYVPEESSVFVASWENAGLISLGKSTTPEMGLTASTEPLVTGATRNPWNLDHIPGGSSGGAAALTAARIVPFAHASDGGGSIRIPASCCGLFGMKPSRGALVASRTNTAPVDISVNHAVTWTVRDSVALFAAAESGEFGSVSGLQGPSVRRLKIGYAPEPLNGQAMDPEVRAKADAAAQLCRELGHEVVDFSPTYDAEKFTDQFILYWAAGAAEFAQSASAFSGQPVSPEIVEPLTLFLAGQFAARQAEMPETIAYLRGFEAEYAAMMEDVDVLLSPTLVAPPPLIGAFDPAGDSEAVFAAISDYVGYTPPMNVSGAPSMSVPLYQSEAGLPIGMMFSAVRGQDGMLFELAYELEQALPWIDRVPPVRA